MHNKAKICGRIVLAGFICSWFLGVLFLYFIRQAMLMPAIQALDYPVQNHTLKGTADPDPASDVYLLGLKMHFPAEGMTTQSAVPFFRDHRVESVTVFLAKDDRPAANVIVFAYPEDRYLKTLISQPVMRALKTILYPGVTPFDFMKKMHRAKAAEFSWWNLLYDARQVFILYVKAVSVPAWYHNGSVYQLDTSYLSGFLAEGQHEGDRSIRELTFTGGDNVYQVIILDRGSGDFKAFLSNIRPVQASEADEIMAGYPGQLSPDLVLASRISRGIDVNDVAELLRLTDLRKKSGETTVKDTGPLKAELEYLKSESRREGRP